ncbi:MAG: DUF1554 domain-containing protein [Geobacteraceae bacterium]
MREFLGVVAVLLLASCGGGSDNGNSRAVSTVSTGPKIFVTASKHVGDFKNDPLLQGANAIGKADYFCNIDTNKPNNSTYKALIVDGVNRDAVNNVDWVLKPNTLYYKSYGNVEIGKTVSNSLLPVMYTDLTNAIADRLPESNDPYVMANNVWTGIGGPSNYLKGSDCSGWSIGDNSSSGSLGTTYQKGVLSISSVGSTWGCLQKMSLYCVEQQ